MFRYAIRNVPLNEFSPVLLGRFLGPARLPPWYCWKKNSIPVQEKKLEALGIMICRYQGFKEGHLLKPSTQ